MRPTSTASLLVGLALTVAPIFAQFIEAPVIRNNPRGVVYRATLLNKDTTTLRGSVTATAPPDGTGLVFHVNLRGFPDEQQYGPFMYHVHVNPVPPDGNCTSAGPHLDPYNRGEVPPCDASRPATCQVGDLSGKHGAIVAIPGEPYVVKYTDFYLSTNPDSNAFIGNRALVVHTRDGARLNCGNFRRVEFSGEDNDSVSALSASATGTRVVSALAASAVYRSTPTPSPESSFFTSAAVRTGGFSKGVVLTALVAFML